MSCSPGNQLLNTTARTDSQETGIKSGALKNKKRFHRANLARKRLEKVSLWTTTLVRGMRATSPDKMTY
jgi:hypothetical protein